jgi:hypothetical protein
MEMSLDRMLEQRACAREFQYAIMKTGWRAGLMLASIASALMLFMGCTPLW